MNWCPWLDAVVKWSHRYMTMFPVGYPGSVVPT